MNYDRLCCWLCLLTLYIGISSVQGFSRCYDCSSLNPYCRREINATSRLGGLVVHTDCPFTNRCFVRREEDGVIMRGCVDGWRNSMVDISYLGCREQNIQWLGKQVWCFCETDLCNEGSLNQLNAVPYIIRHVPKPIRPMLTQQTGGHLHIGPEIAPEAEGEPDNDVIYTMENNNMTRTAASTTATPMLTSTTPNETEARTTTTTPTTTATKSTTTKKVFSFMPWWLWHYFDMPDTTNVHNAETTLPTTESNTSTQVTQTTLEPIINSIANTTLAVTTNTTTVTTTPESKSVIFLEIIASEGVDFNKEANKTDLDKDSKNKDNLKLSTSNSFETVDIHIRDRTETDDATVMGGQPFWRPSWSRWWRITPEISPRKSRRPVAELHKSNRLKFWRWTPETSFNSRRKLPKLISREPSISSITTTTKPTTTLSTTTSTTTQIHTTTVPTTPTTTTTATRKKDTKKTFLYKIQKDTSEEITLYPINPIYNKKAIPYKEFPYWLRQFYRGRQRKMKIFSPKSTPSKTTMSSTSQTSTPNTLQTVPQKIAMVERETEYQFVPVDQPDIIKFECWDCYSASANCRDVVTSPYVYYVGKVPCQVTHKCFIRRDGDLLYRGCVDGWTSSLIQHGYSGCKIQYNWGRPVEWCFCEGNLCNGVSIDSIKSRYHQRHETDV